MDRPAATADYYAVLGVLPSASLDEIKEAYRKLALRSHPDKNRAENATAEFQELGRAWEVLRDQRRRLEYDRNYSRVRSSSAPSNGTFAWARRREQDGDGDVKAQWEKASRPERKDSKSSEETVRLERARSWRVIARRDYLLRRQCWTEFRQRQITDIRHYQVLIRRYSQQMEEQLHQSDQQMISKFTQAIKVSESGGLQLPNHDKIITALMDAKRTYTLNLQLAYQSSKGRLKSLLAELEARRRAYEIEETSIRQLRVAEALDILGPRQYRTPLFSVIDRRQQAINYWMSLARVRAAIRFYPSLEADEGPWHDGGRWERVSGEQTCECCDRPAFHIIPECGSAQCPNCGMIVCNDCYRDLELLREHEAWLVEEQDMEGSLFSLEFNDGAGPIASWDAAGTGRCWV